MCHLVLALPLVGLLLFFFLPLPQALAYYVPVAALSLLIYLSVFEGMKMPVKTGKEGMIGSKAEVISVKDPVLPVQCIVRCEGELWSAISADKLTPGEQVKVLAFRGMRLVVKPGSTEEQSS